MVKLNIKEEDFKLVKKAHERKLARDKGAKESLCLVPSHAYSATVQEDLNSMLKMTNTHGDNIEREFIAFWERFLHLNGNVQKFTMEYDIFSSIQFLLAVFRLLRRYHVQDECQVYIPSAYKFFFMARELSIQQSDNSLNSGYGKLGNYIRTADQINLPPDVQLLMIETLCQEQRIISELFSAFWYKAEEFLQWMKKERMRILGIGVEKDVYKRIRVSNIALSNDIGLFIYLMKFGDLNLFSEMDYKYIKQSMIDRHKIIILNDSDSDIPSRVKFRCLQVFRLYECREIYSSDKALIILWSSIPDEFLTSEDFNQVSMVMNVRGIDTKSILDWYDEHIIEANCQVYQPRSLQHKARYAIRCKLAENLYFSDGVNRLPCAIRIKNYLLNDF